MKFPKLFKTKKVKYATIALVVFCAAILCVYAASVLTANLGTVTVTGSIDKITAASFNGLTGVVSSDGMSVSFASSSMAPSSTTILSITIANSGTTASTIPLANTVVSGNGVGTVLEFTLTSPTTDVTLAPSTSVTFTWAVAALEIGTATPSVTITPTS